MAFGLEVLGRQRQAEIDEAIRQAQSASNESQALGLLLGALEEIRDAMAEVAVESVTVNNLDEVKASLRNELGRIGRPIIKAIEGLKMSSERVEEIKRDIEAKNKMALSDSHDIQIVRKPKTRFYVENLGDIRIPDMVEVRNLSDLQTYFNELAGVIKDTFKIDIPAPQVKVDAPIVNVPEQSIVLPETSIDLEPVIKALSKIQNNSKSSPLAVRLSDGQNWLKSVKTIIENQKQQMTAFSQGLNVSSASKAFRKALNSPLTKYGDFRKTVTAAGTAERLSASSIVCKWAVVTAEEDNTNVVTLGGSTVVGALATRRGKPLFPAQDITLENVDLKEVYLDAITNGEGVTVFYAQ